MKTTMELRKKILCLCFTKQIRISTTTPYKEITTHLRKYGQNYRVYVKRTNKNWWQRLNRS